MLKKIISIVLLAAMFAALAGYGAAEENAAAEAAVEAAEQPAQPVQEEEKELTPAERAAAKGLPEPPDVDISSWEFKVANSYNNILVYRPPYASIEGQGIDSRIFDITSQLLLDARTAGYPIYLAATFRNHDFQYSHYLSAVKQYGDAYEASKVILGAGNSDHQVGLSIDITADPTMAINYSIFDNSAVLETETYQWMLDNCADYGFILRYPEGKEEYYGTDCTAGHFRYVGVDAAKYITENDLCLEEFILLYDEDAIYVPGIN